MHRVSAVPAKKGVPSRLAVDEADAAPLRDGPVTDGHSAEHSDEHVGGTGVVDDVAGRCGHRMSVRFVRRSGSGVSAGFEGPECNLGDRERFKVS